MPGRFPMRKTFLVFAAAAAFQLLFAGFRLSGLPGLPGWHFFLPLGELLSAAGLVAAGPAAAEPPTTPGKHRATQRAIRWITAPVLAALLTYNVGELFYRYFYMSRFRPASDLLLIPGLTRMLLPSVPVPDALLGVLSVLFSVGLALVAGYLLVIILQRTVVAAGWIATPAVSAGLVIAGVIMMAILPQQSPAVVVASQVFDGMAADRTGSSTNRPSDSPAASRPATPSAAIDEPDIHLLVIESYGSTLLEVDEYREALLLIYDELEDELATGGYAVYSTLLRSPAFGGRSWLADATLLTGIYIRDQKAYDDIVKAREPALLLRELASRDYFRIYAAPGTREAPEEWRQAYPFDRYLLRYDFGYEGPFLSLGAMSDQYLLHVVAEQHLSPERPDFVLALLVSSHVPFEVIPVYREEWSFPGRGKEYEAGDLQFFDNDWLSGNELAEGYLAGIDYSLRTAVGYTTDRIGEPGIIVVVGDHQPRKPVSHSVAGYAVPLHVFIPAAYRGEVIDAILSGRGFVPGFRPAMPVPGKALWESEESLPGLDIIPELIIDLLP